MNPEGMLEGKDDGDINIGSALRLIEDLTMIPQSELTLHLEDINAMISSLRTEQNNGYDVPVIRRAIADLSRLRESAR
jgi:hypothetical protein